MDNLGWMLLGLAAMGALSAASRDPRVPATWRLVARKLEGDIYRDEFGQNWLLPLL